MQLFIYSEEEYRISSISSTFWWLELADKCGSMQQLQLMSTIDGAGHYKTDISAIIIKNDETTEKKEQWCSEDDENTSIVIRID